MRFQNLCRAIGLWVLCLTTPSAFAQSLMYNFVHLGVAESQGVGMNRWGDVVSDNSSNSTALLYSRGILSTISPPYSSAYGINDYFQVALYYNNKAYIYYTNTQPKPLGTLGGWMSAPLAINNSATVVGQSTTPDGQYHPFVYSGGQISDLGTLGGPIPARTATAINNPGAIVGSCVNAGGFNRAFRVVNGQVADIDPRTTIYDSQALGINDAGDAVGSSNKALLCVPRFGNCRGSVTNAVIFKSTGAITSIGTLGGPVAIGLGINASGDIVGESQTANNGGTHAFLYTHGVMHDLNSIDLLNGAGWTLITAGAINTNGQIVALALNPTGQAETVILTPVPVILTQLSINPPALVGTFSATGIVTLSRPAPPGGVVLQLGSLSSAAQLPAGNSVIVTENATSATFPITTSAVSQQTLATIWASYNGITRNSLLTIYNYGL